MFEYIQTFAECPIIRTVVFVKKFIKTRSSILESSGYSCRDVLCTSLRFVLEFSPVTVNTTVTCIELTDIVSKCILVKSLGSSYCYIIKLPNSYEHQ